jgi:hypothetical protein
MNRVLQILAGLALILALLVIVNEAPHLRPLTFSSSDPVPERLRGERAQGLLRRELGVPAHGDFKGLLCVVSPSFQESRTDFRFTTAPENLATLIKSAPRLASVLPAPAGEAHAIYFDGREIALDSPQVWKGDRVELAAVPSSSGDLLVYLRVL